MSISSKELFLGACQGKKVASHPPVWIMRQAGRYLPQYQAIRDKVSFLELCRDPKLATKVSLQPIDLIGVDAAIVFSDILLPLIDFGIEVNFPESGGIKLEWQLEKPLGFFTPGANVAATTETISLIAAELSPKAIPVLGFAGAPWTLAHYIIEGGSLRGKEQASKARHLSWTNAPLLHELLGDLANMTALYLKAQIRAGADAIQLFDTWAGELSPRDFQHFVIPYLQKVLSLLPQNTPKIYYIKGVSPYLELIAPLGFDVLSIDWKISLSTAWQRVSSVPGNTIKCLQGNLDPVKLEIDPELVERETHHLVQEGQSLPCGHILNLGHGITPSAKVECAKAFVTAGHLQSTLASTG
ncbi:MAG: uroporphyrinogen decarboxylase [Candidatus Caenarcaniphilales bacterium]|nr:uroporphyrinogen decarboxylase [Candidatus Caenarcaniphilales bacterium]